MINSNHNPRSLKIQCLGFVLVLPLLFSCRGEEAPALLRAGPEDREVERDGRGPSDAATEGGVAEVDFEDLSPSDQLRRLAQELTRLDCERQVRCGTGGESIEAVEEACYRANYPSKEDQFIYDLLPQIRRGDVAIDERALSACRDGLSAECRPVEVREDCRAIFRGLVPLGGSCTNDPQCAGGGYCYMGEYCPGVCRTRVPDGAPCDEAWEACAVGSECSEGECVCSESSGSSCSFEHPCPEGYDCDQSVCTAIPIAEEDQDCLGSTGDPAACEPTHYCALSTRRCTPSRASGERCEVALFGEPCRPGYACTAKSSLSTGTCLPSTSPGESCRDVPCSPGLVCWERTCRVPASRGEPCSHDDLCASGYCEPFSGTCWRWDICEIWSIVREQESDSF